MLLVFLCSKHSFLNSCVFPILCFTPPFLLYCCVFFHPFVLHSFVSNRALSCLTYVIPSPFYRINRRIEWSASCYKSFTKSVSLSVMILVVVNGTFICTSYGQWWSTGITCELIVIYYDLYDVCDMYVMSVIYISCQWCLLCIFFICLDGTDKNE